MSFYVFQVLVHYLNIKKICNRLQNGLLNSFKKAGLENLSIDETDGHPVVYGDWLHAEGKPTILVYGHYDVQPVDPLELWESAPFEPEVRDNKLYARGASDDKGQVFMHVKAVEALNERKRRSSGQREIPH